MIVRDKMMGWGMMRCVDGLSGRKEAFVLGERVPRVTG